MLLWADRLQPQRLTCRDLTVGRALLIGAFQAFAILPGISRSGATIVAGLGCRLSKEEAATFSFLLAIPVIGGAGLMEWVDLARRGTDGTAPGLLILGTVLSFVIGLVSLAWLIQWLKQDRLHWFAWWVLLLGPAVIVWQLTAR
jgi:undecaprenyl-diphosphatase